MLTVWIAYLAVSLFASKSRAFSIEIQLNIWAAVKFMLNLHVLYTLYTRWTLLETHFGFAQNTADSSAPYTIQMYANKEENAK